jgi:hypothetical protein
MYPQQVTMHNGIKEELSITPAIERTYMNANPCVTRRGGKTFQEEWQYAFAQRPKVVMMSEWNEWTAMRLVDQDSNSHFTDQYDRTRSRDIEPMEGGHGDLYYRWMEQYIAAYKNGQPCPDSLLEVNEAVQQIDALPSVSSATEADTSMVEAVRDFVNSIVIKEYDYEIKTSDISNYTKLTDLEAKLGMSKSVGQILNQQNNLVPAKFSLSQNYPNPFNPSTEIKYSIPKSGIVTLKVYNLLGQEVVTLVNQEQKSGNYIINFDASQLASGVYMYRIQSGDFSLTKKMTLLK